MLGHEGVGVIEVAAQPIVEAEPGEAVAIVNTGPADRAPKCSILFSELVASARSRGWIASPYFVPDDVMTRAMQSAAKRGVDVRVLLPDEPDQRFVELASLRRSYRNGSVAAGDEMTPSAALDTTSHESQVSHRPRLARA